ERALREDSELTEARKAAAEVAIALGRYSDAQKHLELLLQATPNDQKLTNQLALCLESAGDLPKAAELFEQVIAYDWERVEEYVRLAAIYRRMNQPERADELMKTMAKDNPDSVRAQLALANYYTKNSQVRKAQEVLADIGRGA